MPKPGPVCALLLESNNCVVRSPALVHESGKELAAVQRFSLVFCILAQLPTGRGVDTFGEKV